jgi:two-component system, LytTR family, sensor kinase
MSRSNIPEKKLKVLLHLIVWTVLFMLSFYVLYSGSSRDLPFLTEIWFQFAGYGIIFYLSYFLLAPRFFFSGRKLLFFITTALLILIFTISVRILHENLTEGSRNGDRERMARPGIEQGPDNFGHRRAPGVNKPPAPMRNWPFLNFLLTSCLVSGLSLGLRFSEKLIQNEKIRKEQEKDKLHTELAFLKHQINPHFLFNTLNSIYSLALIKSDMTAEAVMKLSDMMRYMIQDVEHETVPLALELEYIVHYVELQKIRLSSNVEVQIRIEGDAKPWVIPPMLLVPFIENAFKYGTSSHENAVIRIDLTVDAGLLTCLVNNQIFTGREEKEKFGIGIQNTRQRLQLMYPGRHNLIISNDGKDFMVNLEISLG